MDLLTSIAHVVRLGLFRLFSDRPERHWRGAKTFLHRLQEIVILCVPCACAVYASLAMLIVQLNLLSTHRTGSSRHVDSADVHRSVRIAAANARFYRGF